MMKETEGTVTYPEGIQQPKGMDHLSTARSKKTNHPSKSFTMRKATHFELLM